MQYSVKPREIGTVNATASGRLQTRQTQSKTLVKQNGPVNKVRKIYIRK